MTASPRPDNFTPDGYWPDGFTPGTATPGVGYLVYSQPTPDRDAVKTLVAALAPGTTQYTFTGTPDSVQWLYVRAVSACGTPDDEPIRPKLRRVAFDADGALIPDVPNAPRGLTLTPGAGGTVTAKWGYIQAGQMTAPASFNIYTATDADPFDYDTPAGSVTPSRGMSFDDTFNHGELARFVVRAVSADGDEEPNTIEASLDVDTTAPTAPDDLVVEIIS